MMPSLTRQLFLIAACSATAIAASVTTPATAPSANIAPTDVQVRAVEEFNRAQYSTALPMLKVAADQLKDQPEQRSAIEEDIRVCERNILLAKGAKLLAPPVQLASAVAVVPSATTTATPPAGNGLVSGGLGGTMRTPHPKPTPGSVQEMAIKDLGNFDYDAEKGGNLPQDVLAMDGSSIRTFGYMIPMDQAESITKFALVPSLFSCCVGQPPQIQHTIVVNVPKGKAVNYYPDEISVEGTLHVREKKEDGFIVSVFDIDTTSVKPAPK